MASNIYLSPSFSFVCGISPSKLWNEDFMHDSAVMPDGLRGGLSDEIIDAPSGILNF